MTILESILDDLSTQETPIAVKAYEEGNNLKDPFHDDGEFDLLLSIPVTVVDGKKYEEVKYVQAKLYDFLSAHPSVLEYSRIMIASVFHFFENDPDIDYEISNRLSKYDTIFQVAIKTNFRTFMDVASFVTGINSVVKHKAVFNCPIQYIKRNPETGQWYFDWKVYTIECDKEGVEYSYFLNEMILKAKNRHLNAREYINLIKLCKLLTKNHVSMNMFRKIYAGISFDLGNQIFESIMGDTLRDVNISLMSEFLENNEIDAYGLGRRNDPTSLSVCSYFQVVPVDCLNNSAMLKGRYAVGYPKKKSDDPERTKVKEFLQKHFDGCSVTRYQIKRMYIRGIIDNAPVKLALWLDFAEVPGYDVPCAVLFVISIDKPD